MDRDSSALSEKGKGNRKRERKKTKAHNLNKILPSKEKEWNSLEKQSKA